METEFTLTFPQLQMECMCKSTEDVLAAMRRHHIACQIHGCRGGGCGVCKVHILEGQVEKEVMSRAHVSEADETNGVALACCIKPRSDLTLFIMDDSA